MSWQLAIIIFFGGIVLLVNGAKESGGTKQAQKGINRKVLQGKLYFLLIV
jgi:hypothetical protein